MPTNAEIHATTDAKLEDSEVRLLSRDLLHFVPDCHMRAEAENGRYPLSIVDLSTEPWLAEDFPCSYAATILEVRWAGNHYGEGYERGYWPMIAAIIQFLKHRLSFCRVWYGPDNGEKPLEMTPEAVEALWRYWSHNGCRPYDERSRHWAVEGMPTCASCGNATEFLTVGEAGAVVAYCASCGQIHTREQGQNTWRRIKPYGLD